MARPDLVHQTPPTCPLEALYPLALVSASFRSKQECCFDESMYRLTSDEDVRTLDFDKALDSAKAHSRLARRPFENKQMAKVKQGATPFRVPPSTQESACKSAPLHRTAWCDPN